MVEFDVNIGDLGGELVCRVEDQRKERFRGHTVTDAEATRVFVKLRRDLPRHRLRCFLAPAAPLWLASVNLACHELGDRAVRALVEALLVGRVRVGVVELYKNQLGDASAQALATLVERSPAPGVTGLHLSHNYFTPLGVELMLCAAAVCGHYPRRRSPHATDGVPLWLRVERQLCKWPVLGGLSPDQQLREAQKLIGMKEKTLISRARARGVLPTDPLPDDFKLICIPVPANGARQAAVAYDAADGARGREDYSQGCCSTRCCFASAHGPAIHLPYFWSQDGIVTKDGKVTKEKIPEHASLSQRDKAWRDWAPAKPISIRDRPSAAVSDAIPDLADDAGAPNSGGDACDVLLPVSNRDHTPIKSEPGFDQVKDEDEATDITVGDKVVVEGRQGTVFWDGRPKFDFFKVRWSDDDTLSKIVPTSEVSLVKSRVRPAKAAASEHMRETSHKDSQDVPPDSRPQGMTLVPELKLQKPERPPTPVRPTYFPPMGSSGSSRSKIHGKVGRPPKTRDTATSEVMVVAARKRAGPSTPSSSGKRPKLAASRSPAAFPKNLD